MSIAAVICEFNPFHNGHKYLLSEIKKQGYDTIICVMSGSFTQRGEAAITDKFIRTRTALRNGADLVIELPVPYAVASAERFAKGGAHIIRSLKIVDKVFFGSEAGDVELIKKAAEATSDERVLEMLRSRMDKGEYYPLALQKAVNEVYGNKLSKILAEPNNTLGVEYTKELIKYGIDAGTIQRTGAMHDSKTPDNGFASASLIREMICRGEDISDFVPDYDEDMFANPATEIEGERAVLYKLRTMSTEELKNVPDVTEGLENRILAAARESNSLEELLFTVKTKRYTMARLRRIIACALLGVTKDMQKESVPYIRVLGMTDKGRIALSKAAESTSLPIITSVAPALKALESKAKEILECDIKATDIRTVFEKHVSKAMTDFTTALIKE